MKLKDWLKENTSVFNKRDLAYLLKIVINKDYRLIENYPLSLRKRKYLNNLRDAYRRGWPLAYLVKREDFFGLGFLIRKGVFIPRPETEIIVEKSLEIIHCKRIRMVLDLCCGTSCIAVALKKNTEENIIVYASDVSSSAISVSIENIKLHKTKVNLIMSDLFSAFKKNSFDLIVSNPPYVESDCIKGGLCFEPRISLDGGKDGLFFVYKILKMAPSYLRDGGYLILEIGYNQKDRVNKRIEHSGKFTVVEWIKDYAGLDRGVVLRKK